MLDALTVLTDVPPVSELSVLLPSKIALACVSGSNSTVMRPFSTPVTAPRLTSSPSLRTPSTLFLTSSAAFPFRREAVIFFSSAFIRTVRQRTVFARRVSLRLASLKDVRRDLLCAFAQIPFRQLQSPRAFFENRASRQNRRNRSLTLCPPPEKRERRLPMRRIDGGDTAHFIAFRDTVVRHGYF